MRPLSPNDEKLYDILQNYFKDETRLPMDEVEELIYYGVILNNENDNNFIANNWGLCTRCANCCSTKPGIYLNRYEYNQLPPHLKDFFMKDNELFYKIKDTEPCVFLTSDNRCSIYNHRPSGCKAFPLTDHRGRLFVARDIDCPFIVEFFKIKIDVMIQQVLLKRGKMNVIQQL